MATAFCQCFLDDDPCGETHCPFCKLPLPSYEDVAADAGGVVDLTDVFAPRPAEPQPPAPQKHRCPWQAQLDIVSAGLKKHDSATTTEQKVAAVTEIFSFLMYEEEFLAANPKFCTVAVAKAKELRAQEICPVGLRDTLLLFISLAPA